MNRRGCRLFGLCIAVSMSLAAAASATAGTYSVKTCADAAGHENRSWFFVSSGETSKLEHGADCSGPSNGEFSGLWVRDAMGSGSASSGDVWGYWSFTAPAKTSITSVSYSRYLRTYSDDRWRAEVLPAVGAALESCQVDLNADVCTRGASGGQPKAFAGLATSRIQIGVRCASGSSSLFCINGTTMQRAQATLYGATVTINDPVDPSVGSLTGSLFGGGWLRGTKSAGLSASDETGIARLALEREGGVAVQTMTRACDYRLPAPCAGSGPSASSDWSIDTSQLSDGTHTFTGVAEDTGQNEALTSPVAVQVDNTPPAPPNGLSIPGGVWSRQAARSASWALPGGQAAPVTAAQVKVCPSSGGGCSTPAASTTGSAFALPRQGQYAVEVRLIDAAGNVSGRPATATVGYDATAPAAPVGLTSQGATAAPARTLRWLLPGGQLAPIMKATAVVCREGGGCFSVASGPTSAAVVLPEPGSYVARVQLTDAAGNISPAATMRFEYAEPATRRRTRLAVSRVRLTKRSVIVRGRVAKKATGRVTVRLTARKRTVGKRVRVRRGGFHVKVRLRPRQRGAAKVKVRIAYGGDKRFKPRARTVIARRGGM